MKAHATWKVLAHGPIEELTDSVWRVEGELPNMPLRRVMTVVRLPSGELLIHSAIAVDDATRARIEGWGPVRWVLVPSRFHRLDAPAFRARYPEAKVLCPAGSRKKVEEVVPVDGTYADFPGSPEVRLETIDGTGEQEGAVVVRDGGGATLIVNDAVFNQPHIPGIFGFLLRVLDQSGGPRIEVLTRLLTIKDKRAFAAHLRRFADEPDLRRVVVSHLEPIVDRPAAALRELADGLSP